MTFTNISVESWRRYEWESGYSVTIENPIKLNVSSSGGHLVEDAQRQGHYIAAGWVHISWKAKDGEEVIVA